MDAELDKAITAVLDALEVLVNLESPNWEAKHHEIQAKITERVEWDNALDEFLSWYEC